MFLMDGWLDGWLVDIWGGGFYGGMAGRKEEGGGIDRS